MWWHNKFTGSFSIITERLHLFYPGTWLRSPRPALCSQGHHLCHLRQGMTCLVQTTSSSTYSCNTQNANRNKQQLNEPLNSSRTGSLEDWVCATLLFVIVTRLLFLCVKGIFIAAFWRSGTSNNSRIFSLALFDFSIWEAACHTEIQKGLRATAFSSC